MPSFTCVPRSSFLNGITLQIHPHLKVTISHNSFTILTCKSVKWHSNFWKTKTLYMPISIYLELHSAINNVALVYSSKYYSWHMFTSYRKGFISISTFLQTWCNAISPKILDLVRARLNHLLEWKMPLHAPKLIIWLMWGNHSKSVDVDLYLNVFLVTLVVLSRLEVNDLMILWCML